MLVILFDYKCVYLCVILRWLYSLTTVQQSYLHASCLCGLCCYSSSGRGSSSNYSSDGACLAMKRLMYVLRMDDDYYYIFWEGGEGENTDLT